MAYAVYLSTAELDQKYKTTVRKLAPTILRTDEHLFMFCKYSTLLRKAHNQKGLSTTARKAILNWYEAQPAEAIKNMWLNRRGAHGFTHKYLIKICHISDETLGEKTLAQTFFKTCTELLKESETKIVDTPQDIKTDAVIPNNNNNNNIVDTKTANEAKASGDKTDESTEINENIIISMSKLRTTKNKAEALKIIRKFKLNYNQVPVHLLRYAPIMEALIPTMSYMQLLHCWRNMAKNNHFEHPKIFKLCQDHLENRKLLHKANIHPIIFLMQMHELGIRGDLTRVSKNFISKYGNNPIIQFVSFIIYFFSWHPKKLNFGKCPITDNCILNHLAKIWVQALECI